MHLTLIMRSTAILFILLVVFTTDSAATIEKIEIAQWQPHDIKLQLEMAENQNPFMIGPEYEFVSESGERLVLKGFYNGNKEYIIRFTPHETGTWLGKPIKKSWIKDQLPSYEFSVSKNDAECHGAIVMSTKNPQKLFYEDGTPYNMLAFELDWLFALDYGDRSLKNAGQLLDVIKEHGFNKVIMNVYAFDRNNAIEGVKPQYEYGSLLNIFPFMGTNEEPDYSRLNIRFFQHLDNIISLMNEKNIIAHLMIYVWNKNVNWPKPGSEADEMYFDYIIKRYQAYPNIIWDVSKEALSYGKDDVAYISRKVDRVRELDSYGRLLTVHDQKYCSLHPEKVDIMSTQDWSTDLYNNMLSLKNKFPEKPIFNIEHGCYEHCQYDAFIGNYTDEKVCLRRNYECLFAGVYSTYYWQCSSWNVIIYNPFDDEVAPQPKFVYYKYLRDFMDRHRYEQLMPVEQVSASGFALKHQNTYEYYYYVPEENSAIDIKNLPKTDSLELQWFDTYTGRYSQTEVIPWSDYFREEAHFKESASILIIKGV